MNEMDVTINGYELRLTCYSCPEQYDVFDKYRTQVAYLRLRHGKFYAAVPDVGGKIVYESLTIGDGIFDQNERMEHLNKAIESIQEYLTKG